MKSPLKRRKLPDGPTIKSLATDRDIEDIVARADAGLYEAKAAGRNRCVLGRLTAFEEAEAA